MSRAPLHVLYQLDFHRAEFAEAGWLTPIDGFPNVEAYKQGFRLPRPGRHDLRGKAPQALGDDGSTFAGEVVLQEPLGADLFVEVGVGDLALTIWTAPEGAEQLRGRGGGTFAPRTWLLFDPYSERRLG